MKRLIERIGLNALRGFDPETAHGLALKALALMPGPGPVTSGRLAGRVWGLDLLNPIGIAAGFDKNAVAVRGALRTGAGFLEIGAVTPRPQQGNPRPRLFRLPQDGAVINRFGFNNEGMEVIAARLVAARRTERGIVGVNLGANKDSADRVADFAAVLRKFAGLADFFTINVSSPNTERLRDLQGRAALDQLLADCLAVRDDAAPGSPVLLKISPDLDEQGLEDVAQVCLSRKIDGIVATNTTLARIGLHSAHAGQAGGLSGRPMFTRSTETLRQVHRLTGGAIPLVGVGGVASAEDAYAKIRAGACLVQLYTAMVYDGPSLPARIARGLDALLARDGFACVKDAVGVDA